MMKIGRNASCPCGSGKKYKRCCSEKDQDRSHETGDIAAFFTSEERAAAIQKLMTFALLEEFDQDHEIGMRLFWGGRLADRSEEEIQQLEQLEQPEVNFNSWFFFDMEIDPGKTIADFFLTREGNRLSPGERAYLRKAMQTHFRLFEVEEVIRDQGFRLKDLWTEQVYQVRERAGTHYFVPWDLMATRLMDLGNNDWVIDGGLYNYPTRAKASLLKGLRAEHRSFRRDLPGQDDTAFFKRIGLLFNHAWLDWVVFPPLPQAVTTEGDEVVFTRVLFDVRDGPRLMAALQACAELELQDEKRYGWIQEAPDVRRTLGSLDIQGSRLVLETLSKERGERGRELLERIAGDAIRYRLTEYQDQKQILKSTSKPGKKTANTLPPELEAKLLKEFLDKHYQKWLDEEIPALSHRTPRHAVTLKTFRPKVVALLKEMENMEARAIQQGKPPYDFGWLWKELGVEGERG